MIETIWYSILILIIVLAMKRSDVVSMRPHCYSTSKVVAGCNLQKLLHGLVIVFYTTRLQGQVAKGVFISSSLLVVVNYFRFLPATFHSNFEKETPFRYWKTYIQFFCRYSNSSVFRLKWPYPALPELQIELPNAWCDDDAVFRVNFNLHESLIKMLLN